MGSQVHTRETKRAGCSLCLTIRIIRFWLPWLATYLLASDWHRGSWGLGRSSLWGRAGVVGEEKREQRSGREEECRGCGGMIWWVGESMMNEQGSSQVALCIFFLFFPLFFLG
ncbi:hypothetical protein B0J18DRAFT_253144 [Chaetomium sp. MPI-SDFR-AT-0129]|nr:hypothetical protein B0J18DRAFT_253144 [Chaetomium sp. MPI-SDFR-AT-0129]